MRLIAIVTLVVALVGSPTSSTCLGSNLWTHCDVGNSGESVDIGASVTQPGRESQHPSPPVDTGTARDEAEPAPEEECLSELCRPLYEVESVPEVTLADLVSFVPARPALSGEPEGFGVVGMPANVVASASEQRIAGTILDWDVVVRFVPAAFVFDYGDGTTQRSTTGGASWAQLGQAQFTPTATSHVYAARGTYPVRVTVQYAPFVDFGGGWIPVAGYVESTTGGYDVEVVEVRTALVEKTCVENPSGPGC